MSVVSPEFRSRFRARIEAPVAGFFGRLGLTPNALTLIGFGIAIVGAWLAATQNWLIAGLVVGFGAAFDLFDGALARATGKASKLGAFMDSVFDRAGEAVVYVGIAAGLLAAIGTPSSELGSQVQLFGIAFDSSLGAVIAALAMGAAFMVSYTRAKSEGLGFSSGTGIANVGFAPREVRSVILTVALVLAGLIAASIHADFPAEVVPAPPVWWIVLVGSLALIAILATLTTLQRILFVYNQSKSTNQPTNEEVQK